MSGKNSLSGFALIAFRIILNSTLQITAAGFIYDFGYAFYEKMYGAIRRDIAWGIGLELAKYLFVTLAILIAIANNYLKEKKHKLIAIVAVVGVFMMFFISNLFYSPYRTTLLIASAIGGFLVNLFFIKGLFKKSKQ